MASTIPTPFVGGGQGGSGLDSRPRASWAPPYWPEGEAASSAVDAEPAPSPAEDELVASASAPAEPEVEESANQPEVEAEPTVESVPESVTDRGASDADEDEDDVEYPDYLFGPDQSQVGGAAAGLGEPSDARETMEAAQTPAPAADAADDVETVVRRLLDGPEGERIRRLASEMTGLSPEEAIARAFAAGYLSGRDERDEGEVD